VLIGRLAEQLAMILSELLIPCPGHRCRRMINHNAEIVHRDLRLKPGNAVVDVDASRNSRNHPASTGAFPFFSDGEESGRWLPDLGRKRGIGIRS
jgi:hypothetical protein